jgi:hypothetical protein
MGLVYSFGVVLVRCRSLPIGGFYFHFFRMRHHMIRHLQHENAMLRLELRYLKRLYRAARCIHRLRSRLRPSAN